MKYSYFLRVFTGLLLSAFIFNNAFGQTLSGTYTIPGSVAGNTVTNLTELANLMDAGVTINGTAIFEFTSSYSDTGEIFPIIFIPFVGTGNAVIRPAASVSTTLTTAGATSSTVMVGLQGVKNLTFDGRPGGTGANMEWQFQNTTSGTSLPTFQFINGAVHDTLEYITIEASGTNTIGTITFNTSTVAGGNSNDVIQYCNIGNYSALPYNQIYSNGTAANPNSGNKILNNNIYNFQGYYSTSYNAGISITTTGNGSNWVISGNSLYANTIVGSYGYGMSGIYFSPGSTSTGNTISGNYIGGKAPMCGGGRMDFRGDNGYTYPDFNGIYINAGTGNTVSGNTIQNILCDSRTLSQMVCGINIVGGSVDVVNNVVGSATDTNDIHQGGLGVMVGIWDQSASAVTIDSNTVANLTVDAAYPPTSWTYGDMIGIYIYSGDNTVGASTVINNKVFNLSTSNTDNYNQYYPINGNGTSSNSINYAQDLLAGICLQTSGSGNQLISENLVYNLELNATGGESTDYVYGIISNAGTGTNTVNGNTVYALYAPDVFGAANYFLGVTGIYLPASTIGKYIVTNNMIDLGFQANGAPVQNANITGIWDNTYENNTSLILHIYHNSVYIGGADSNRENNNLNSYCLQRNLVYGSTVYDSLDIRNNIFVNNRTTTSASAKNYALYLNSTTDAQSNYNELYGTTSSFEIGGIEDAANYPTLLSWRVGVSLDANSLNSNPEFISDSVAPYNLHVQVSSPIDMAGTIAATIVYDIDSFIRANYTPVDIGAAVINACGSNTLTPAVTLSPSVNDVCPGTSITFTATPTNGGSVPTYDFYRNGVSVQNGASDTYTSSALNNNDSIRVVMTSDTTCLSTPTATSTDVTVVIKAIATTSITQTICQGKSFGGHSTSGTYTDTLTAYNGCDSIVTLHLTVTPAVTSTVTDSVCPGQSYGGHSTTGTFVDTLQTAAGCDSIRTLHLTVKPYVTSTVTDSICPGQSYDGYTDSGTYIDTLSATAGCDTIRTLHLTVKTYITSTVMQSICPGQSFDGQSATGTYIDTLNATIGCDTIRTLHLTVLSITADTISQSICAGNNYDGHTQNGTYIDTFQGHNGCDSIRTLNLTVLPISTTGISQTICQGQSFDGHSTQGIYKDTLQAYNGCDSIVTLTLTVLPVSTNTFTQSICQGQSFDGHNANGTFTDTLQAYNGCDSIVTLHLTVLPVSTTTISQSICSGQSYDGHNANGAYIDTFPAYNGCDSIRTLHLTVQAIITDTVNENICPGNSYDGHNQNGTYRDTFQSVGGCDSIRTLNLTVLSISTTNISQSICQGQTFDGHTTGGNYTDTLQAYNGCDSIVTLTLTVLPVSSSSVTQSICQGQSYDGHSTGGTFTDTLKAYNGCDSIVTLHLTVLPVSASSISQTVCQGQSYDGHSTTGTYVDTLQAANGCDSIRTLTLTVRLVITDTVIKAICAGNYYDGHNQTGTYIDTFQAVSGCDSIRTLNLTVYPVKDTSLTETICQGERYGGHTSSGIFTDTLQSQYGCDSIRTVILTVLPVSTTTIIKYICQGQTYNGHTTNGNYVDTLGAANGCDSIVSLTLFVQSQITTIVDDSICAGSNYFGYTQSGSYKDTFIAVGGCDSIRALNLLVFPLITTTVTTSICPGMNYGGHDTTGTYVDTLQAANGCDSIRTLYLSLLPISFGINKVQICQGDSFQGHHTGGNYEDTLTAFNGCDSIVTLELTVYPTPATPLISRDGDTLISSAYTGYQWYQANNKLASDTSQGLFVTQDGYYSVLITDTNNCSSTSAIDTFYLLGIAEITGNPQWKIFPNPASEEVNIELNGIEQNHQVTLRIFDVTGRMQLEQVWTPDGKDDSRQLNLDNFAEGLYLIQISQDDWSVNQRIIISR